MTWLTLVVLGIVIGANNLSAALALGALGHGRHRGRIVTVFAVFEFSVPLVGTLLGQRLAASISDAFPWLGAVLLIGLGVAVLVSVLRRGHTDERLSRLATSWQGLVLLGAGLSADNLVIGFSLGLAEIPPLALAATIVVFSSAFTFIGVTVGNDLRRHWERRTEIAAGLLLIALGVAVAAGWP